MTEQEIFDFRKQFQRLVWLKGEITSQAQTITKLESWNKGDSHTTAIKRAVDELGKIKLEFRDIKSGRTYGEWRNFSKSISYLSGKIKSVRNDESRKRWQILLNELKWNEAATNQH